MRNVEWRLEVHIDYMHIRCVKCNKASKVTYLGTDPSIPRIQVTCSECGNYDTWKIENAEGFPGQPD